MTADEVNALMGALLEVPDLDDDEVTLSKALNDGGEVTFHLTRQRDYLHVFYPLVEVAADLAPGVIASGLFMNMTGAKGDMPALSFEPETSSLMARTSLWLPALAPHQLASTLDSSLQSCMSARRELSAQLCKPTA